MTGLDLIVEVGTEEIPAGYIGPALEALEDRLKKSLAENRLTHGRLQVWATPRRLAVGLWDLLDRQPDAVIEVTGPPVRTAYDQNGQPTRAALGFAKSQGVDLDGLALVDTPKGQYLAARRQSPGRPAREVLTELLPGLILGLPFPKSMRWGKGELVFVRPIHWLLAVLGGQVLPMSLGEIKSSNTSRGHRFLAPKPVAINGPGEYEARLAEAQVTVSTELRLQMVRAEIARMKAEAGGDLTVLPDEDLVLEVANLVEQPIAVLGRFDSSFLALPGDILITAMREHQRYFALADARGGLAPYFIAINNTRARDMNVVRRGHERVLRARLDDARFYFEEDRKTTLESKGAQLEKVVYHTLLGTSSDKVRRVIDMTGYTADLLEPDSKPAATRAALLAKCDLVSGVVGQFPSLQGVMGRAYALADGEPEEVAAAIHEHYLPIRAGGDLPRTKAGAVLAMADKIETICGCFGVGLIPTGAADPYALRRQALGVINILLERGYRVDLGDLVDRALEGLKPWLKRTPDETKADVLEFFRLRLKNQLTAQGASPDGAEAVLALFHRDASAAAARVRALEQVKARADFADLAAAFKRVVNIIRKFGAHEGYDPARVVEEREKGLSDATGRVEEKAQDLVRADDFAGLLAEIVGLKPAVDDFFDQVLVDDPDPAVKANRLALLTRVAKLFELVADFSKINV
ncbi:MAG: glycine--tRNA ligase subunit beta [Pseudomonadota bacterium]